MESNDRITDPTLPTSDISDPTSPPEASPATTTTPPTTTTTTSPTTTTTPADEGAGGTEVSTEGVFRFDDGATASVELLHIISDIPPGGYNGFQSVITLDDGSLLASGFDAQGDGVQPERSAVWTSFYGQVWTRTGAQLSDPPGQQTIQAMFVEDGEAHAVLADVRVVDTDDGTFGAEFGVPVVWSSPDGGVTWTAESPIGDAAAIGAHVLADGGIVLYGVARPNSADAFAPALYRHDSGGDRWVEAIVVDAETGGDAVSPGAVIDLATDGDTWFAVGMSTREDPAGRLVDGYLASAYLEGPTDPALWRSDDAGLTWSWTPLGSLTGEPGSGSIDGIVRAGDAWYVAVSRTIAYRQLTEIYRSDDGVSWSRVAHDRSTGTISMIDTLWVGSRLAATEEYVILTEERFDAQAGRSATVMTMVQISTGETVTRDITDDLGLTQIEAATTTDDGRVLLFGRVERGFLSSDLQVAELVFST
ncbi:MAG: hypothetical protein AAF945_13045 [Actinomycetota bacterium]